jgi:hypothetical protein
MTTRQKLLMVTFFYDPLVVSPDAVTDGIKPVTEERLFTGIEECLERGGLVRVSHVEADLVRLAGGQHGSPPAHEWLGLTFVPVQPAAKDPIVTEENADAT